MRRNLNPILAALIAAILLVWQATSSIAVDLESFEFNDPNFTELADTANTANPLNQWATDINLLTDSFVFSNVFEVRKFSDVFAASYLQIDNITSGTSGSRYIVAEMSGWDFRGPDVAGSPTNPEQIRFGFIDEDTGTDGNTVVAQVQITRDIATEGIQLEGTALGTGATSLNATATLNTAQTAPFTMVLELNKSNNSYEAFYKDGTNPSQSLGSGFVDPGRDGNSIRFVVNNNFGSELDEVFSIDRVALTDTNPLTDLLTLEVNRDTGLTKLINTTGSALSGLESYSITSAIGALDSIGWKPITDNYDKPLPGNGSVDADDDWAIDSSTTSDLSESALGGNGGNLSIGQEVVLSTGAGLWIQSPREDLLAQIMFAGGVVRNASVNFVGNGGNRFEVGDLNFDGSITAADWPLFLAGSEADLSALSRAQAYQMGDLNFGGVNSFRDFEIFKEAFDVANGTGSFVAMLAGIPEPSACVLLAIGCLGLMSARSRRHRLYR